jgi:hypothetical protein
MPLNTDYLGTLTGAHLVATPGQCVYCVSSQIAMEESLLHQPLSAVQPFFGLPAEAVLARPLGALSPQIGFSIFVALSLLAASVAGWLAWTALRLRTQHWRGAAVIGLAVFSLPAAWNYWLAQWDALLLLPAIGAAVLLSRRRPLLAGLVLAVLLAKPQTVWLVPIVLVVAHQWRMLAGLLIGGCAWIASSLLLVGVHEFSNWLPFLFTRGPTVSSSIGVPGLAALIGGNQVGFLTAAALCVGTAVLAWTVRLPLSRMPILALALGLALSAVAAPHLFGYDLILMTVPICVLGLRRINAALICATLLTVGHLADYFVLHTGAAETLAVLLLTICVWTELRASIAPESARQPVGSSARHRSFEVYA